MEKVHFGHTTYPHLVAVLVASYMLEQYKISQSENKEKWNAFLDYRDSPIAEYNVIVGAEFSGDIDPMGLSGEFHETGIKLPVAGNSWEPVQIDEGTIVHA